MSDALRVEVLLRRALAPVEPPDDLAQRLQSTFQSISDMAADELENWELAAMRDPRNWARPVVALVAGGGAGAALVVLRARQRSRQQRPASIAELREQVEYAAQDLAGEARRLLDSR
ncbi:MAG: hypothetical protein ACR2ND_07980 [Solirubrobacteraceae bacterium]